MNSEDQGVLGTFSVRVTLPAVLFVVGLIAFFVFCANPDIRVPLTYACGLTSALAVIFSCYYLATNSELSIRRDQVHRAFEFTKQLNDVNIVKIRTFLEKELDHRSLSPSQFYDKVVASEEISSSLKSLLGTFEDAAIAVQCGYVDEKTLYKSLSFLVPWSARHFQPYIQEQRRIAGDGTLYAELDKLADAWKNNKSLKTGKSL